MDPWAIVLLSISASFLFISAIVIRVKEIDIRDSIKKNGQLIKCLNVLGELIGVLVGIVLFPILFILAVLGIIKYPRKKTFKKLTNKGFSYAYKNKKYILRRNEIIIEIQIGLMDYYISLDNGETFVRIEESNLGTSYEREKLKQALSEYINAHPVDKQRGDAVPPLSEYIEFLNLYI